MELDEFLCERNVERYRLLANSANDPNQRRVILELLVEEKGRLKRTDQNKLGTSNTQICL
jgi:hypothetical protein